MVACVHAFWMVAVQALMHQMIVGVTSEPHEIKFDIEKQQDE